MRRHRKSIVSIRFMPILNLQSEAIDYSRGRYVMLDRDGLLSLWSISVRPIRYYWIGHDRFLTSMHYTDMVVLYPTLLIAVASTSRCITIWEVIDESEKKFSVHPHCKKFSKLKALSIKVFSENFLGCTKAN